MEEIQAVRDIAQPRETLLVVDGLTGQDAVNVATEFEAKVGITGVVLTRMDGDGRGGAALSMRAVTGKPIRFVGLGEKMDALETFEAERVAGRILGMGDIVALVERARETFEAEQAERMAKRFAKGLFNMNDMRSQLEQMMKMGGMQGLMGMLPGMGGMAKKAEAAGFNDKMLAHQVALINSMTKKERANPDLLAASRKKRIAKGAGMEVSDLNKLIKQHQQMADMIKKMGKGGMMKQAIKQMVGKGAGGGMPDISKMSPEEMAEMAKGMQQGMGAGGGFPGLPRGMGLPQGLSGMMKKK
jgi:signal recognition particle subunit SRP54